MLIYLYMYRVGIVSLVLNKYYLLLMLMRIEYLSVVIFFFLYINMFIIKLEMFLIMIYLVFCVCEGVLGLCLLVVIIRCYGNNYVKSLSLLKC